MKTSPLSLPEQKNYEYAYKFAYKLALEQLGKTSIKEQCRKSGAKYQKVNSQQVVTIEYLNQPYQVTLPDIQVSLVGSQAEVPLKDKILILHYLARAKGVPIANKPIAFKELPEGTVYFPTFAKRSIEPVTKYFGGEPQRLLEAAERFSGRKVDYGDVAVTISAFSHVPITIVLWRGDAEFPPRGNILFDATISDYLSTEDIIVLCENITWKLVKFLREGKSVG
jgi:hypothetical protein